MDTEKEPLTWWGKGCVNLATKLHQLSVPLPLSRFSAVRPWRTSVASQTPTIGRGGVFRRRIGP